MEGLRMNVLKGNSRKFHPLSTVPDSEDESLTSEEDVFFVSNRAGKGKGSDGQSHKPPSTSRSNRLFAWAVLGVVVLITLVVVTYIVYLFATPIQTATSFNGTETTGKPSISTPPSNTDTPDNDPSNPSTNTDSSISWQFDLLQASSESTIMVYDINQDGIKDIIFNAMTNRLEHSKYRVCPNEENSCLKDVGFTPCRIRLVALDGKNGSNVWEKWIPFPAFATNCKHDLNLDGIPDCTFSGREGSFAAINPVNGFYLWFVDPALTFPTYNYYFPLFVRDFDRDGVTDIVITHGGDTIYRDDDSKRSPGFIFVVSGRTGQQLSDRILTPDGHETYSNPVAFNISGKIEAVLFGTGGETIAGSLWAITVHSLQEHVDAWAPNKPSKYDVNKNYFDTQCLSDEEIAPMRPTFLKDTYRHVTDKEEWLAKCPVLKSDTQPLWNPYKVCVYELVAAGKTGTITPPVIIDYNGDGVKDLLVSQFNDHIMMMDGATNTIQWDHLAEDTQSYSIPSPIQFNDDDIPDFLVQFNKGKWMNYDYSYMGVIDGSNGELLWSLNCSLGAMSSAITVKSSKKGHDGMLFMASGCEEISKYTKKEASNVHVNEKVVQHLEPDICPSAHWGVEQSICMAGKRDRNKRHGGDMGEGPPPDGYQQAQVMRPIEVEYSEIENEIPTDIWSAEDESDSFPDPWRDTQSFLEEYCEIPYNRIVNKIYFITPNIIKSGVVKPIATNYPYVFKSSGITKRQNHVALTHALHEKKTVRCAHTVAPMMLTTTPTIGDFDEDGKIEAAWSVIYDGFPNELYSIREFHPSKVSIEVVTLEKRMREVYGSKVDSLVDFSSYYPAQQQPWAGYMGSRGDCIYEQPS